MLVHPPPPICQAINRGYFIERQLVAPDVSHLHGMKARANWPNGLQDQPMAHRIFLMDNDDFGMPPATDPNGKDSKENEKDRKAKADARREVIKEARGEISWGLGGSLLVALLLAVFVVQNTADVEVKMLWWEWSLPLAVVIFGVAVLAVVLDELAGVVLRRRRRRRVADKAELERLRHNAK